MSFEIPGIDAQTVCDLYDDDIKKRLEQTDGKN